MPFTARQWCFPGLRTLISGECFPCWYRCLLKHILVLTVTAVLGTAEQTFAVKSFYFRILFGHFSYAAKLKF